MARLRRADGALRSFAPIRCCENGLAAYKVVYGAGLAAGFGPRQHLDITRGTALHPFPLLNAGASPRGSSRQARSPR